MIPIRCMTCGKPVGHLWEEFKKRREREKDVAKILDNLGLKRYCCRALFLTHVDLIDRISPYTIHEI